MNKIEVIHKQKNIFGNINCSEYNGMYLLVTVFVSAAVNTPKQTENLSKYTRSHARCLKFPDSHVWTTAA